MQNISLKNAEKIAVKAMFSLYSEQVKFKQYGVARETSQALAKIDNSGIGEYNYALLLSKGLGGETDLPNAREWYKKAVDKGYIPAMSDYASMLFTGKGGPKDLEGARSWFKIAADRGYTTAMSIYAYMCFNGEGGAKDLEGARAWFKKAADRGHAMAMTGYANALCAGAGDPKDLEGARAWFKKAADKGDTDAMSNYADMLSTGKGGAKDLKGARAWLKIVAEKGDDSAMNDYAVMLFTGEGGPKDLEGAKEWFQKAADKGYAPAMYSYACMLLAENLDSLDAKLYIDKGKKDLCVVCHLKQILKFFSGDVAFFKPLTLELTVSELDQLIGSDIQPIHQAWLQEQKKISINAKSACSVAASPAASVSAFAAAPAVTNVLPNEKGLVSIPSTDTSNHSTTLSSESSIPEYSQSNAYGIHASYNDSPQTEEAKRNASYAPVLLMLAEHAVLTTESTIQRDEESGEAVPKRRR